MNMEKRDGKETEKIALEEIKRRGKVTVTGLAKNLGWSTGKAQGALTRLVMKGKVTKKKVIDHNSNLIRVYYSIKNDNINDEEKIEENGITSIPRYYTFLDSLFGELLKTIEGRKIILNVTKKMGIDIGTIIEMQKEAKKILGKGEGD